MVNYKAENLHLKFELIQLKADFKQLLELNNQVIKENKILRKENEELKIRVSKLEHELEKYKVKPNEPSGSKPDFEKANKDNPQTKSGQKKGHKGTSRLSPFIIHKHINYSPKFCEHCGSHNLKHTQERIKVITDLEFQVINSKEHYHDMKCLDCGLETKPKSIHGTSKSPFGKVFQTLIGYLRSVGGMTIRPLENLFQDFFKLEVSDTSISNNEIRLSNELLEEYNKYLDLVKQGRHSHKDETSYRINGQTNWIWVYDSLEYVFYRLANSRSKSVIKNDFGVTKQISVNDCYNAYDDLEFQQICWAHLIREASAHADKENATKEEKRFSKELHEIYKQAKIFIAKDPPLVKRQEERAKFENQLCSLMLSLKNKSEFLERICNRLGNRLTHCFLFVEVKDLPATNNQAERSLRPFVCHRKVSQGSKSENGGEAKVRLKTMFENAKRKGEQLVNTLDYLFEKQEFVEIRPT